MKVQYTEIFKLKVMLDKKGIPHEFLDRSYIDYKKHELQYPFYQIIVYNPNEEELEDRIISVVQGHGTYGESQDLLEIQGCLTEKEYQNGSVLGYLDAKNVLKRIKKEYFKQLEEVNNESN